MTVDNCPTVVAAATPFETPLDKAVSVSATGVDVDGDVLTYRWSAPTGTFPKRTVQRLADTPWWPPGKRARAKRPSA